MKNDMKSRQVVNRSPIAGPRTPPQFPPAPAPLPQKVSRTRSNSTSMTSPPASTRKRTSSGVFQVDESEPMPKKTEVSPCQPDTPRPRPDAANGRKKTDSAEPAKKDTIAKKKDVPEKKKIVENVDNKNDKVIEKFDSKAKSNCVTAFKESDSWD